MKRWYKGLKGQTIVTPEGLVVVNKGSVKLIDRMIVEKHRYIEREILEEIDKASAEQALADDLHGEIAEDRVKQMSAAKAARHRARQRHALKVGVDASIKSPTKARSERHKARKARAGGGDGVPANDPPVE